MSFSGGFEIAFDFEVCIYFLVESGTNQLTTLTPCVFSENVTLDSIYAVEPPESSPIKVGKRTSGRPRNNTGNGNSNSNRNTATRSSARVIYLPSDDENDDVELDYDDDDSDFDHTRATNDRARSSRYRERSQRRQGRSNYLRDSDDDSSDSGDSSLFGFIDDDFTPSSSARGSYAVERRGQNRGAERKRYVEVDSDVDVDDNERYVAPTFSRRTSATSADDSVGLIFDQKTNLQRNTLLGSGVER